MENAPPQLVFFPGKMENQALIDVSGRNTVGKVSELTGNRQIFQPTNLADWFILEVTDNLILRTLKWIGFIGDLMAVISEIFSPPSEDADRKKISPTRIQLCLWNPVTLQSIDLPVIEYEYSLRKRIRHVLITSNPNNPDCLVLVFLNQQRILLWDVNGADKSWTNVVFPDDFFVPGGGFQGWEFAVVKDSNSVLVRTGLLSRYPFAVIEIQRNPKRLVIRPQNGWLKPYPVRTLVAPNPCTNNAHWVVCNGDINVNGDIFAVNVYLGGSYNGSYNVKQNLAREVVGTSVFKLEYSSSTMKYYWKIQVTCPNNSFFISSKQVLCFPTTNADEGNKVYMVLGNDQRVLYTYHIENKTLSRCSLPNVPDCAAPPYWISGFPSAPPRANPNQGKYRKCANEEKKNVLGKKLDDLPLDILKHMSSCFIKNPVDYLNFRAINKLFRSVGLAKEWTRNIRMCPMLMIPLDNDASFMVDPVSGSKYNLNTSLGDGFSALCSSPNGWLLMYNDCILNNGMARLRLYNPLTKSVVSLPDIVTSSAVFTITKCRVVKIPAEIGTGMFHFSFIDLGRKDPNTEYEWNMLTANRRAVNVNQSNINPACIQGKDYYYLVENGDLAAYVYKHGPNRFYNLVVIPLELPCRGYTEQRFIVAGHGDDTILSIYIGKEWKWLRVFKFDTSKSVREWVEVEDLGGHNVYLSTMSCICKGVEFPMKGNRIYLTRFHGGRVVYYSMDTRKFHAGEGDSSVVVSYYESEEQLHSYWFEPSLALEPF